MIGCKAARSTPNKSEVPATQRLFATYCRLAGVERAESLNNMWARKSFANTTLGDLQMPSNTVMTITGHKSEQTLRQYYSSNKNLDISRLVRAPLTLAKFLDGSIPRIPRTTAEVYSEVVNQLVRS